MVFKLLYQNEDSSPVAFCFVQATCPLFCIVLENGEILRGDWSSILSAQAASDQQLGGVKFSSLKSFTHIPGSNIRGVCSDASGALFVTDTQRQAILKVDVSGKVSSYVSDFEGKNFLGPHSIAICAKSGQMLFTDSGLQGESGLHRRVGGLFAASASSQVLSNVCQRGLAYPSSVVLNEEGNLGFLAETCSNRILRLVEYPSAGVWQMSAYRHLRGRFGPMALALHERKGTLFVGQFDAAAFSTTGRILVLDKEGETVNVYDDVPGSEIVCMAVSPDGHHLVVGERSTHSIYVLDLCE